MNLVMGCKNLTSPSAQSSFNMECWKHSEDSKVSTKMASSWEIQNDRPGQVYHGFLGNVGEKPQRGRNEHLRWVLEKHLNPFS